jgi:FG-GAP-like repeat
VADVNGDGVPDILVANIRRNLTDQVFAASNVGVTLGNGDGTFQPAVTYPSGGSELHSIAVADVNNDGKLDIIAGNGCSIISQGLCSGEGAVGVLLGNGDGTFRPAIDYGSGGFAGFQMKCHRGGCERRSQT